MILKEVNLIYAKRLVQGIQDNVDLYVAMNQTDVPAWVLLEYWAQESKALLDFVYGNNHDPDDHISFKIDGSQVELNPKTEIGRNIIDLFEMSGG